MKNNNVERTWLVIFFFLYIIIKYLIVQRIYILNLFYNSYFLKKKKNMYIT